MPPRGVPRDLCFRGATPLGRQNSFVKKDKSPPAKALLEASVALIYSPRKLRNLTARFAFLSVFVCALIVTLSQIPPLGAKFADRVISFSGSLLHQLQFSRRPEGNAG